jgi:hypothetical protein
MEEAIWNVLKNVLSWKEKWERLDIADILLHKSQNIYMQKLLWEPGMVAHTCNLLEAGAGKLRFHG